MPGHLCPSCGRAAGGDDVACAACGAVLPATADEPWRVTAAEVARALGPHYRVESLLGRGGYAIVFRVTDLRLERPLAVKALIPEFAASPELAERFRREARTAARLSHPNIVPIFFVGDETHAPCYAMPLVDGETLASRLRREGALDLAVALGIARDVAAALDHAHAAGVVHRDVKPENVLIEQASGRSLLADFGIAKALEGAPGLTVSGIALGTPRYMAPEQVSADPDVDGRADVYGLGVVLYEMLAGNPPFEGRTAQAVYAQHLSAPVPPIWSRPDETAERVMTALRRALAKSPGDRFASAGALVRALEESAGRRPLRRSGVLAAAGGDEAAADPPDAHGPSGATGATGATGLTGAADHRTNDDVRLFRALRASGGDDPLGALATTAVPAEAAELVGLAELEAAGAAERGDAAALLRVLRLLAARANDPQPGVRQPVRDLLRRVASRPEIAPLLAVHWRAADDHAQGAIEQVLSLLIGLHDEAADALVREARREKAPELFLLADRVGALDDRRSEALARDPGVGVVRALVLALGDSARTAATIERRLAAVLRHPNAKARLTVLEAVAERGGALAERIGRVGLADADAGVRLAAIRAMGASRRRDALPDLARALERGTREEQAAAAQALGRLAIPGAVAPLAAVFERKALLRKERGEVQLAAARALAGMPRELAGEVLAGLAEDRDPEVAKIARQGLAQDSLSPSSQARR